MKLAKKIIHHVQALPESKQIEVLDFVEYLREKTEMQSKQDWTDFTLTSAMRGMEEEYTPYSLKDIKESFS